MGRIKNTTKTYIYEGETEKAILGAFDILGRKVKFNLLQQNIARKLTTIRPGDLYLIIDLDDISQSVSKDRGKIPACIKMLKENIAVLIKDRNYRHIFLILQYYNLEDEILRACSVKENDLLKHFDASNADELKTKMIASQNLASALNGIGFSEDKLWSNSVCEEHKGMIDGFLKNKKVKIITLKDLMTR